MFIIIGCFFICTALSQPAPPARAIRVRKFPPSTNVIPAPSAFTLTWSASAQTVDSNGVAHVATGNILWSTDNYNWHFGPSAMMDGNTNRVLEPNNGQVCFFVLAYAGFAPLQIQPGSFE